MKTELQKIIFINTHPIQYFAPLYTFCNKGGLQVEAWYCSDESIRGQKDVQFGQSFTWDIPLLDGYPYRFFKNHSWKPSIHNGMFGIINLGMIKAIFKEQKAVIIVHGWGYLSLLMTIVFGAIAGHKMCLRSETPWKQEQLNGGAKLVLRKLFVQHIMFRFIQKFLSVGVQNKSFYHHYGVKEKDIVFIPYAVDNDRFKKASKELQPYKDTFKSKLGIPSNHKIILFSGKYISKKRPMDLLKAFRMLNHPSLSLIMIGEGELRGEMENYIRLHHLKNIYLTGFVNQSVIAQFYALGDVFVMCSQQGETWGLSINEAMNFSLPIVASDLVGSTDDLITPDTGFTYKCGDVNELTKTLNALLSNNDMRKKLGENAKVKIEEYSYAVIKNNLQTLLN